MRYCPYCHRWNAGRPQRCYYCGHSWHIRLCPRSHENPHDAQFCGTCGSADLTDTAGPRPWWIWILKGGFVMVGLAFLLAVSYGLVSSPRQALPFIVAIALLLFGYGLTMSIMSGPTKKVVQLINRLIKKTLVRMLHWFWDKI